MRFSTPSSRLSRRIDKQNKRAFVFGILGIITVLFLLFQFGIPLLTKIVLFFSGNNQDTITKEEETVSYIPAPLFTTTFEATNSAPITLKGTSQPTVTVRLYVNDELYDETKADERGNFLFSNVALKEGQNEIKTKATRDKKQSDLSEPLTILYRTKPPDLTIDSPSDKQTFTKDTNRITMVGKTNADVKVTVNGFWAIVDTQGNFSYSLTLQNGENKITVKAEDNAGNKTEKEITVSYSP